MDNSSRLSADSEKMLIDRIRAQLSEKLKCFSLRPFFATGEEKLLDLVRAPFYKTLGSLAVAGYFLLCCGALGLLIKQAFLPLATGLALNALTVLFYLIAGGGLSCWVGSALVIRIAKNAVSHQTGQEAGGVNSSHSFQEYELLRRKEEQSERERFERNMNDGFLLRTLSWNG